MLLKTHQHGGVLTIGSSMAGDREAPQQMIKSTHHIICTISMISVRGRGCAEPRGHPTPTPAIFCCCLTRDIEVFVVVPSDCRESFALSLLHHSEHSTCFFIDRNVLIFNFYFAWLTLSSVRLNGTCTARIIFVFCSLQPSLKVPQIYATNAPPAPLPICTSPIQ